MEPTFGTDVKRDMCYVLAHLTLPHNYILNIGQK